MSNLEEAPKPARIESPKDAHFSKLNAVIETLQMKGQMLVRGVDSGDEDADEEDEDEDGQGGEGEEGTGYTAEQMTNLRHILINDSRDKAIKAGHKFASCGQDTGFGMFNTHTGNMVIQGIPKEVSKCMKKKTISDRFDCLFGLTHGLKSFDTWMFDNEEWGEGNALDAAIKLLATSWRDLLKEPDAVLGIDSEYTRPGIECLLDQFAEDCREAESISEEFYWKE
jgi:hypothetical protein